MLRECGKRWILIAVVAGLAWPNDVLEASINPPHTKADPAASAPSLSQANRLSTRRGSGKRCPAPVAVTVLNDDDDRRDHSPTNATLTDVRHSAERINRAHELAFQRPLLDRAHAERFAPLLC